MQFPFRTIAFSSALCLGLASSSALFAQNSTMNSPQNTQSAENGGMHHGPMSPDQELAHLTKKLNLTSDQQTQIKPILENRHDQMMQMRGDTSLSRPDKMAKMKSLDDDSNTKLEAVLNDQQKPKYEKMIANRKEHMQERRANRGDDGAQAPSSTTSGQPQ